MLDVHGLEECMRNTKGGNSDGAGGSPMMGTEEECIYT